MLGRKAGIETAHQPFIDGLAFRQDPDAERRIEVVHAFQQPLVEPLGVEQQGMDARILRLLQNAFDVDLDLARIEADRETLGVEAGKTGVLESVAQLAHDLAQRGARLLLIRPAPQQADQPLAALALGIGQREIAEHGRSLARPQFDKAAVDPQREAAHQRDRQTSRGLGHGSLSRSLDTCHPSHRKSVAVGHKHVKLI